MGIKKEDWDEFCDVLCDNGGEVVEYGDRVVTRELDYDDMCRGCVLFQRTSNGPVCAWYTNEYSDHPNGVFEQAFEISDYDGDWRDYGEFEDWLHERAGVCPECGRYVGADNLNGVSFAGTACDDCIDAARAKYEYPGWYN